MPEHNESIGQSQDSECFVQWAKRAPNSLQFSSMVFENGRLCKGWGGWVCGEDGGFRDGYEIGQNIISEFKLG